jgi:hypothetical protein
VALESKIRSVSLKANVVVLFGLIPEYGVFEQAMLAKEWRGRTTLKCTKRA